MTDKKKKFRGRIIEYSDGHSILTDKEDNVTHNRPPEDEDFGEWGESSPTYSNRMAADHRQEDRRDLEYYYLCPMCEEKLFSSHHDFTCPICLCEVRYEMHSSYSFIRRDSSDYEHERCTVESH